MHISYRNRLLWQIKVTHPLAAIIYNCFTYPWRFTRVSSVDTKVVEYPKTKRSCSPNVQLHVRVYYMKRYECCWIHRKRNIHVLEMYIDVYITWTIRRLLNTHKTKCLCSLYVHLRVYYMIQWLLNTLKTKHSYSRNVHLRVYIWHEAIRRLLNILKTKRLCSRNVNLRVYYMKRYEGCWITFMFSQCTTTCILVYSAPYPQRPPWPILGVAAPR